MRGIARFWPLLACLSACSPDGDQAAGTAESAQVTCNKNTLPFGGGDGTAASPYLLCAPDQLVHIGDAPYQAHYRLAQDIDLTKSPVRSISRFVGVLDGAGHALVGLVGDGTGDTAWIDEQRGHIKNFRMRGARIKGDALLAQRNYGVVESSEFEGEVTSSNTAGSGGIVAHNLGLLNDVRVKGTINGTSQVGGIAGVNTVLGRVRHAYFEGKVTGGSLFIGGIAGSNEGLLVDVHAKGSVLMGGGVGRGAGGIAGWQVGGIDLASADVTTYAENSAGGIVGRARGGRVSRAVAKVKARANENAGGIVGLVEFGAGFEDSYAVAEVNVDHSGAQAFGGDCARCFVTGTVGGTPTSIVSTPNGAGANLADPQTFAAFGDAWDLGAVAVAGHPRLAWESAPPAAPPVDVKPVQISAFRPTGTPKTLVFRENTTQVETQGAFGRLPGQQTVYAVVYVPPGEYTYAVSKSNDGFWNGTWCKLNTSPGTPWTATPSRTLTVGADPVGEQSIWITCPEAYDNDWPEHPGPGQFMSGLPGGTVLLDDDGESQAVPWTFRGLWHRVTSTPCVTPSAASGVGAFHYGDPNGCHYDHRPSTGSFGSIGTGWMNSPALAGLQEGSTIEFDSYRDIADQSETCVVLYREGKPQPLNDTMLQIKPWMRRGPQATDGAWEHVTIKLPYAYSGFYAQPLQVSFVIETRNAFDHRDHKGWLIDNVKITR